MKIDLGKGHYALIDDSDIERVIGKYIRLKLIAGMPYAAIRHTIVGKQRKESYLHRYLLDEPENKFVDHINGDTLDNRKDNLRLCNHQDNMRNSKKRKHSRQLYKGIVLLNNGTYTARISINGKYKYLGRFETAIHAALAYNEAAKKYFGEFARLNDLPQNSGSPFFLSSIKNPAKIYALALGRDK